MPSAANERFVLLNHLVSTSKCRARSGVRPPTHGGFDLLQQLATRQKLGWAIEFANSDDDADDAARLEKNKSHSFFRISDINFTNSNEQRYAELLVEYVNHDSTHFPVVDITTFVGREIQGTPAEKGATTCHVVVRLPSDGEYDDGRYRCVIEAAPMLSRRAIEFLLCRQLRRISDSAGWTFDATISTRNKAVARRAYRYTPRLELHADVGGRLDAAQSSGRELSVMTFTKRSARQSIGQETDVTYEEFETDVQIKVSAKQGPASALERLKWALDVRRHYENQGFDTSLSFRHAGGVMASGQVHPAIDGATDLLMCARELIELPGTPKLCESTANPETTKALKEVLERDHLWEHTPKG